MAVAIRISIRVLGNWKIENRQTQQPPGEEKNDGSSEADGCNGSTASSPSVLGYKMYLRFILSHSDNTGISSYIEATLH